MSSIKKRTQCSTKVKTLSVFSLNSLPGLCKYKHTYKMAGQAKYLSYIHGMITKLAN